ncbi:putative MFS monocarboxylate transporter [Trichoderma austrokoningii]
MDKNNVPLDFDTGINVRLQVLGAFFLWGIINTFGVFQTFYEQDILSDMSASSNAWIGSVESFLLLFVGIITGPLFDAGYLYILLPFGSCMVAFGYMMTSLGTEYYQIMLAQGLCVGIGTGCLFVPAVAVLPQYFQRKRALANGIAATGASISGVGFLWATRALGFVCFGTCAISIAVMRIRTSPKQRLALLQLSAFKELEYSLFCVAMFFGFLGFYNFLSYVQPWAMQERLVSNSNNNMGFYLVPMVNAASTVGRLAPNFLADLWGPLNILSPAAGVTAILAFCWIAVHSTAGIIVLTLLYGGFPVNSDLRDLGTRLGMMFAVLSVALLLGTPIGGAILSGSGSYAGVQVFCGVTIAVCSIVTYKT